MTTDAPTYGPFDRPLALGDPYRCMERDMGITRVVRVVCDGCGAGVLSAHIDSGPAEPVDGWFVPCNHCGSATARFYDSVLVERGLAAKYGFDEAA